MTIHDRRIHATRNVEKFRKRILLKQGASTINLWGSMPPIHLGSPADDWKAVGADLRNAMSEHVYVAKVASAIKAALAAKGTGDE